MTFLPEQRLLTNISLQFVTDGVAQELNETFTITFTGVETMGMDLEFGATIIPEFTGTIVDVDGIIVSVVGLSGTTGHKDPVNFAY